MAQKHLHELLTEAQEPFLLENYIANWRLQLKKTNSQTKKTKSVSKTSLRNNSCFFSHTHSPDCAKSPVKNRAQIKTIHFDLSLLLDAAERIKKSNSEKPRNRIAGFGAIIKKFIGKAGAKCEKSETSGSIVKNEDFDTSFDCSCSARVSEGVESDGFSSIEKCFRSSPVSTFPRSPQNGPSTCLQSQEYSSPSTSPVRHDIQGNDHVECILKKHTGGKEKDQFSPISILETPFEEDAEQHENEEDEDVYNIECSYAVVQRAKEQLLERLLRFEKLAKLDPVELERSIRETKAGNDDDEDDYDDDDEELEEHKYDNSEKNFKFDWIRHRFVSDLIAKSKRKGDGINERNIAAKRACQRAGLFEKKEFETKIDMIAELDLRRGIDHGWKTNDQEQLDETAIEVELSIFGLLVEELIEELL